MVENRSHSTFPKIAPRDAEILAALIQTYLATGQPVASKALSHQRADGLSSASIRNTLASLEEAGYLFQPHTSAGRVPTLEALRLYVKALDHLHSLDAQTEHRLLHELGSANDESTMLSRACHFLSEITRQLGVVAVVPWPDTGIRDIRFIRLTDRRVLTVAVTTDGQIRERVARVPEDYTQDELDKASRYFAHHFSGFSLERIRKELLRRVAEERAAYDQLLKRVLVLYHCGLLEMQDTGRVYLEGTAHLIAILRNHERLSSILEALAEKEKLLALLTELVRDGDHKTGEVRVRVGLEEANLPEISVIATSYHTADHTEGAIGIIGPTRMEYDRAMGAVARVGELFNRVLRDS